ESKAAVVVLADLEHVFRVSRHPVRVRAAERERQPHLPDTRRGDGRDPGAVDRRAADRPDRAADRRLHVRPHLDAAGTAAAVLPDRCGTRDAGADRDAEFADAVDRGRSSVGAGRIDQHFDGAVPRVRRRPASREAAPDRLCDAELLHRHRLGDRKPAAVAAGEVRRRQHRGARRSAGHGALCVLFRRRGAAAGDPVDGAAHARIPARAASRVRRGAAAAAARTQRDRCAAHGDHLAARGHCRGGGGRDLRLGEGAVHLRRPAARLRRGAVAALDAARLERVHPHHGRPVRHADDDAATRGRAVLLVVRAVFDVDLHHGRGHRRAFRQRRSDLGRLQRRRELG
ncbi:MAG: Predicted maltose transporter MalT, partial [uncultured Lysobacter sp.]